MFEHDATQQPIRGNPRSAKILGAQAPATQLLGSQFQELAIPEQFIELIEGNVFDGGDLFGESEVKERGLPGSGADHA